MPPRTRTARAVVEVPTRVDLVVQGLVGGSRALVRGLFDHGCVVVDDVAVDAAGAVVAPGSVVVVTWEPGRGYKEKPRHEVRSRAFSVVHDDPHLVVVEKRAGVLTVPTVKREPNTLVDEVSRWLSKSTRITRPAHLVHRLDRDTSGLLVFGKSTAVGEALVAQFAEKKPERLYDAIAIGDVQGDAPDLDRATIESFLATDEDLDQHSTTDEAAGKRAVTHFRVVERLRGATLLEVQLETGRRNQIRVHLAERGHPLLGEARYRVEQAKHPQWPHPRLALHARVLGLVHPVTGQRLRCEAKTPPEFARFVQATRRR